MNPDLLALALINDPNFTLRNIKDEQSDMPEAGAARASFEMIADNGELIGYIKTWHHDDDYAGFVHFDAEGNVVNWNTMAKKAHKNGTKAWISRKNQPILCSD